MNNKINKKGLDIKSSGVSPDDLNLINQHTLSPLTSDDVFIFDVVICDNEIDRVYDKMSVSFLEQVAEKIKGVTGLQDHDWSVENQTARIFDASVVVDDSRKTTTGEPYTYVLGRAYTLSKYKDYIEKINAGLLKESSLSFKSENDTCSICGAPTFKGDNDLAVCENGHIAGHSYFDEKIKADILCFNNISDLVDVLEWSLVAVPCQRGAGVKNKSIGGISLMTKAGLLLQKFMASKAYTEASDEDKAILDEAVGTDKEVELTEEDIKKLVDENEKLKAKVKQLEAEVKEAVAGREQDNIKALVSKELDTEFPGMHPKVREALEKEIPWDDFKLEDGQIPGMADVLNSFKEAYKGLYTEKEEPVEEKPKEVEKEAPVEEVETPEVEKAVKKSGITFGVSKKKYENYMKSKKSGIYFN